MNAPQQDTPRPKMPSLRTLLVRAVIALEEIAAELHALQERSVDDEHDELVCGETFSVGAMTAGSITCTRAVDDAGAHVQIAGLDDAMHLHRPSATVWGTPQNTSGQGKVPTTP